MEQKFDPGRILSSRAILERSESDSEFKSFIDASLERHISGDWGDVVEQDKKNNDDALKMKNMQIISVYKNNDDKIYIITEWDKSSTLALFSYEY